MPVLRNFMLLAAAVLSGAAACSKPDTPGRPDKPVEENGEFPIVAWAGIDAKDADVKFGPMKDAGFNVYLDWYDSFEEVETVLDAAEKNGVKVIVRSRDFLSDPAAEVKKIKDRDGLFGYFIIDEPETSQLKTYGDIVSKVQKVDSSHPCYINLYPNWAWGGADSYLNRLSGYLSVVQAPFLSFDFYPILKKDGTVEIREGWYKNLEDVRKLSRAKKIPFWAFALSLAGEDSEHPTPTLPDLRLQQFVNLAYGAQGFQYWTYWGIYHSSPTSVYNPVKQVNRELKVLARYFCGADVTGVWHTGGDIPYGTSALSKMPAGIRSLVAGGPALVSEFSKGGRSFVAVVNKNCRQKMSLAVEFEKPATRFDREGFKSSVTECTVSMDPGDIIVFQK